LCYLDLRVILAAMGHRAALDNAVQMGSGGRRANPEIAGPKATKVHRANLEDLKVPQVSVGPKVNPEAKANPELRVSPAIKVNEGLRASLANPA